MTTTAQPFDDIRRVISEMPEADLVSVEAVRARDRFLTKPPGSLGRLEEIVEWLAAWQRKARPAIMRPLVTVFAGNHGVTARGVSPYPASVTQQMLDNFGAGGAAINQICKTFDIGFKAYDLALELPTGDITVEAAMDEKTCVATMAFGMEAIGGGHDLVGIGEMGIGNTTISAAIYAALYGGDTAHWVGRGTGGEVGWDIEKTTTRDVRDRCNRPAGADYGIEHPTVKRPATPYRDKP